MTGEGYDESRNRIYLVDPWPKSWQSGQGYGDNGRYYVELDELAHVMQIAYQQQNVHTMVW